MRNRRWGILTELDLCVAVPHFTRRCGQFSDAGHFSRGRLAFTFRLERKDSFIGFQGVTVKENKAKVMVYIYFLVYELNHHKCLPSTPVVGDRCSVSDGAVAAIASTVLHDVGLITSNNSDLVVDENKLRREKAKVRKDLKFQALSEAQALTL
ncbi:hypothetical protein AVEN_259935-1 [Araneus ventricosus]|uniref:Uncharacterized protein n=1 Tax=Araneus ventricosus TaxID=182803 RepID=A0A4Y2GLP5_ARAVE|nr:hypothetical protein AVEN_259935-1 [Araneus ventricosus]